MTKNGIGFFGLLGLIFITLKLTDVIDWSWWLVLMPLYWGAALGVIFVVSIIAAYLLLALFDVVARKL